MSDLNPAPMGGAAIGLDHVGIVGSDVDVLARAFSTLGFFVTPVAIHASGRTANRCVMLRDGGYLELMSTVAGKSSATLDRFLARGPGAHILALEVDDEERAADRLRRAGIAAAVSMTERDAGKHGTKARFALIVPPDPPEGRWLLIRQLTREFLWRSDTVMHPNHAVALLEVVYAIDAPAETMTRLSRLAGRPAVPDARGGYRIPLARGCVRVLPCAVATELFPDAASAPPLIGLTIATESLVDAKVRSVNAGGVGIRFVVAST